MPPRASKNVIGAHSIEEMAGLLKRPRKVMLMVKAGAAVDEFIELVLPHLEPGDVIIDGGNSHFPDTIRRTKYLESKGMCTSARASRAAKKARASARR